MQHAILSAAVRVPSASVRPWPLNLVVSEVALLTNLRSWILSSQDVVLVAVAVVSAFPFAYALALVSASLPSELFLWADLCGQPVVQHYYRLCRLSGLADLHAMEEPFPD